MLGQRRGWAGRQPANHVLGWDQPHLQGVPRYDQGAVVLPSKGVQLQVGLPSAGHLHQRGEGGRVAEVWAATHKPLAWVTDVFRHVTENW